MKVLWLQDNVVFTDGQYQTRFGIWLHETVETTGKARFPLNATYHYDPTYTKAITGVVCRDEDIDEIVATVPPDVIPVIQWDQGAGDTVQILDRPTINKIKKLDCLQGVTIDDLDNIETIVTKVVRYLEETPGFVLHPKYK